MKCLVSNFSRIWRWFVGCTEKSIYGLIRAITDQAGLNSEVFGNFCLTARIFQLNLFRALWNEVHGKIGSWPGKSGFITDQWLWVEIGPDRQFPYIGIKEIPVVHELVWRHRRNMRRSLYLCKNLPPKVFIHVFHALILLNLVIYNTFLVFR
jgi:hypothetical protein